MTVTIMMFFGCLITYILRLNIGFALVCMIKKPIDHNPYNISENFTENLDVCSGGGHHKYSAADKEPVRYFDYKLLNSSC